MSLFIDGINFNVGNLRESAKSFLEVINEFKRITLCSQHTKSIVFPFISNEKLEFNF